MTILVIGLGSMGKRRIRLIKKYNTDFEIIGVDTSSERREQCSNEYGIISFACMDEALVSKKADCAFVCTSPLSHSKIITYCLENNLQVFTELNLVDDGYDENIRLAEEKQLVLFLSSTFLYRKEILKIKELCDSQKAPFNYVYHVGQYLPDWHPWESYNNFFVGDKRTNGCREIFAIEMPWIINTFSSVVNYNVISSKMTDLNIDYNDNYIVMLEHENGSKGTLIVDIVSRKAVRNLEVLSENLYLNWDGSPTGLYQYDTAEKKSNNIQLYDNIYQLKDYSSFVVENAYYDEIVAFFDAVTKNKTPLYSFEKDRETLNVINKIEGINENTL